MHSDQTLPPSDHEPAREPAFRLPQRATQYGGQRIGPYEVIREIARGGQGVVLHARRSDVGHEVALKLLLRPTQKSLLRFRQEGQVLARIQHPNVMRVIDLGEHQGLPYLAMELLDAQPLDAELETSGPPPREQLVDVLEQVALALQHCHELGLVHRDLKPDNILIERQTGRPILVDFGLVKRDRERFGELSMDEYTRLSKTGDMQGTPAWMAPEQIMHSKGKIGPATDVHALGLILFTLLSGQRPFEGNSFALLRALAMEEAPDPRTLDSSIPRHLAALCQRALAKSPDERPSAAEFARALRAPLARSRGPALLVGAALLVGLALAGIVVQRSRASTPSTQEADSTDAPEDHVAAATLAPAEVLEGEKEWGRLKTHSAEPAVLFAELTAWLTRYRRHPLADEVRAAQAAARLRFPLARLPVVDCNSLAVAGKRLVTTHRPGTAVHVWEVDAAGKLVQVGTWSIDEMRGPVTVLPGGEVVLFGTTESSASIEVREQLTGTILRTFDHPWSRMGGLEPSRDGRLLACVGVDDAERRVIRLLDAQDGAVRVTCLDLPERVSGMRFSPGSDRLLAGYGAELVGGQVTTTNGVVCFDASSGEELWRQQLVARPGALAWDPNGQRVLVGTNSGELIAYEARTGLERAKFKGQGAKGAQFDFMNIVGAHNGALRSIDPVPGLGFVSVSGDTDLNIAELRVWSAAGEEKHRVLGMPLPWHRSVSSPAALWAALSSPKGVVELWALPGFSD